jgi:quinol monooxygenase YgiN
MSLSDVVAPEMPFVAIFTLVVKPERRADFLDAMERAMARSALEPGILSFTLLVDQTDHNRFTAYDVYRDRAAYEAHLAEPHNGRLIEEIDGCMMAPPSGSFHHRLCGVRDLK